MAYAASWKCTRWRAVLTERMQEPKAKSGTDIAYGGSAASSERRIVRAREVRLGTTPLPPTRISLCTGYAMSGTMLCLVLFSLDHVRCCRGAIQTETRACACHVRKRGVLTGGRGGQIEEHLGQAWIDRLILARDKTHVMGCMLIDDKPVVRGYCPPRRRQLYCKEQLLSLSLLCRQRSCERLISRGLLARVLCAW